jgi:hypothetical protein
MRITLLGLLVVVGAVLLVVYAIHIHQEKTNRSDGTGREKSQLPDEPDSRGRLPE